MPNWHAGDGAHCNSNPLTPTDFPLPGWPATVAAVLSLHLHPPVRAVLIPADVGAGQVPAGIGLSGGLRDPERLKQRIADQRGDTQTARARLGDADPLATQIIGDVLRFSVELLPAAARNRPDPGNHAVTARQDDSARTADLTLPVLVRVGQDQVAREVMPAGSSPQRAGEVTQPLRRGPEPELAYPAEGIADAAEMPTMADGQHHDADHDQDQDHDTGNGEDLQDEVAGGPGRHGEDHDDEQAEAAASSASLAVMLLGTCTTDMMELPLIDEDEARAEVGARAGEGGRPTRRGPSD